jgi:hypothetical protein
VGVTGGVAEAGAHTAEGGEGEHETLPVEVVRGLKPPFPDGAENGVVGTEEAGEVQLGGIRGAPAEFVEGAGHGKSGKGCVDDKGGESLVSGGGVGAGEY